MPPQERICEAPEIRADREPGAGPAGQALGDRQRKRRRGEQEVLQFAHGGLQLSSSPTGQWSLPSTSGLIQAPFSAGRSRSLATK